MHKPVTQWCHRHVRFAVAVLTALAACSGVAAAQGVTTASIAGVVKDSANASIVGAKIVATHEPTGTTYEATTQADGHFAIQAMRVGGPYKVVASFGGFATSEKTDVTLQVSVTENLHFNLQPATVAETVSVTVKVKSDPVFGSSRTGAATSLTRAELGTLPTISGRLNDVARLTPQFGGSGSFAGQDSRMNNITVDGSYFNNSFGLRNSPGDTSGVAPISLEAIEQIQVNVAPFDVRQGNFIGAGVNTVTRSGSNQWTASAYHRMRNQSYVGTEAKGLTFNPGVFDTTDTGEWVGGPIRKDRLFFFESFENQQDTRPLTTFASNPGGVPATGNTTRVLASDLTALSQFLDANFKYATGPFDNISKHTPGQPFLLKGDFNASATNRLTVRYNYLNSSSDQNLSSSNSLGQGRQTFSNNFLNFQNSNYSILEDIRSGVGELNSVLGGSFVNNVIVGYTKQNESRGPLDTLFPFVDILDGNNVAYTSFGSEPFTPNNELRYNTFQTQDTITKYMRRHSLTFGGSVEKYHSENVFYPGKQSAYVYNSLQDFYTDASDFLANPSRTTSPVTLKRFQVRYTNIPGLSKPIQPLDVIFSSGFVQDEWRLAGRLTMMAGVRVDVASFGKTGYDNPNVDALTFRNADGTSIQYNSGALPKTTPLWSPRVGFNLDVAGNQATQLRGGTGIFTGKPAYVWISNQVGNTGMLTGFVQVDNTTAFPFNPNPDAYKPAVVTGAPATSVDLAVTDPNFKFPQTWRTNIGVDHRLVWGMVATGEFIYNKDVNGMAYFNANLPAAQSSFVGPDDRPRYVGTSCATATAAACSNRINNAAGDQIIENIVLGNESVGYSWDASATLSKLLSRGFAFKAGYHYGVSKNTVDAGSIAAGSWTSNAIVTDPNNPSIGYSANSPGQRFFLSTSYSHEYFGVGQTTVALFFDAHTNGNTSYLFSADMNGDSATNDLIYIPRGPSEMNFQQFAAGGKTFTAADQAAAFEAYIQQDKYLSQRRGQYAQRGAVFYPIVKRLDFSLMQDVFHKVSGTRQSGQIRLDITNIGNFINSNWGVGQSIIQNRILSPQGVDAQGQPLYRLATVTTSAGTALVSKTFQTTAGISDVYVIMLSFRYTFQ